MENKKKDKWDKFGIILKPVGGLLAALTMAAFGFFGSSYLEHRQDTEMRVRLYTELMSKREEAESALRKDMFRSIIDSFLNPQAKSPSLESNMLQLELLAYNFHESLNLKPLFIHLKRQIADDKSIDAAAKLEYLERLFKVAREVTRKQVAALELAGAKRDMGINWNNFFKSKEIIRLEDFSLAMDTIERDFRVSVQDANPTTKEIKVKLEIRTPKKSSGEVDEDIREFWVGFFDFPLIDNTRLSHDQRCAIILNEFRQQTAQITVLYFPGSHASLKDKPYYREMVESLIPDKSKGKI